MLTRVADEPKRLLQPTRLGSRLGSRVAVRSEQGVSLIEILVALVVLSIGLLGLAGLQATSLQLNAGALARSQATVLATDIMDRMRANRPAAIDGDYNIGASDAAPAGNSIAEQDLSEWKDLIASYLPDGQGAVAVADSVATVTLSWSEPWDDDATDGRNSVVVSTQL